jgi:hypothetical protein
MPLDGGDRSSRFHLAGETHAILKDCFVIEGHFEASPVVDPLGGGCIVASLGDDVSDVREERYGNGMTARVTSWLRIDANQP